MDAFYWLTFHGLCLSSLAISGLALYRTADIGRRQTIKRRKGR
jgi:hypothetical protein